MRPHDGMYEACHSSLGSMSKETNEETDNGKRDQRQHRDIHRLTYMSERMHVCDSAILSVVYGNSSTVCSVHSRLNSDMYRSLTTSHTQTRCHTRWMWQVKAISHFIVVLPPHIHPLSSSSASPHRSAQCVVLSSSRLSSSVASLSQPALCRLLPFPSQCVWWLSYAFQP